MGINDIHLIFSDVQTTIYKKVKFWSGRIFSNWHIINVFSRYPLFSYFSVSWWFLFHTQLLFSIKLQNLTRWHLGEALNWNICLVRFSRHTFWPCVQVPQLTWGFFFLIEVLLIYNAVLVSGVQQSVSVMCIYIYFFRDSFHYTLL